MHRRLFITGTAAILCSSASNAQPNTDTISVEDQKGDADASYEAIRIDQAAIENIVHQSDRAIFEQKAPNFGALLLASATDFLGNSRSATPDKIEELLSLFDLPYRYDDGNGAYVPFCAAGIAFAAALAYARFLNRKTNPLNRVAVAKQVLDDLDHWYYYPSPSVRSMYLIAEGKGRWKSGPLSTLAPQPGWIVIYNFGKGADHCGIVESVGIDMLNTIEFNTTEQHGSEINGGVVARKQRKYDSTIKGFIRI